MKYLKVAFACSCLILVGCGDNRSTVEYWQKERCMQDDKGNMYTIRNQMGQLYFIDPGCKVYKK